MKDEYAIILIQAFLVLGLYAIIFLVLDLFEPNVFVIGMLILLPLWTFVYGLALLVQAFKINYKIIRKND